MTALGWLRSSAVDLIAAQQLARALMIEHGLIPWSFKFDRATRRFGSCWPGKQMITLSWKLTMLNDIAQVRNTILHEIAHALSPGDGHGPQWRAACKRLGITPERCFTAEQVAMPVKRASRYEIGCATCVWWHARHRITGRPLVCRCCRKPVIFRERLTGRSFRVTKRGRQPKIEYLEIASP